MLASTSSRSMLRLRNSLRLTQLHHPSRIPPPPSSLSAPLTTMTIPHYRFYASSSTDDYTQKIRARYQETKHDLQSSVDTKTQALRSRVDVKTAALRQHVQDRVEDYKDTAREIQKNPVQTTGSMVKTYGPVFIGTYLGVYVITLSSLYAGIQSGVLDPVQLLTHWVQQDVDSVQTFMITLLEKSEFTQRAAPYVETYPWLANFGVAWIATKFTEPIRIPLAAAITPKVARWTGWSQPKTTTTPTE